jgi:hypothetical protein
MVDATRLAALEAVARMAGELRPDRASLEPFDVRLSWMIAAIDALDALPAPQPAGETVYGGVWRCNSTRRMAMGGRDTPPAGWGHWALVSYVQVRVALPAIPTIAAEVGT